MNTGILAALAVAGMGGAAVADVEITEIYLGISGEDGTADWFEITNNTGAAIDTADYWYDDVSAEFGDAVQLTSTILNPGESAVVLIGAAADQVNFDAVWGAGINVVFADGGAGLGQGGDAVNLFLADMTLVQTLAYGGGLADDQRTIEYYSPGPATLSELGVNGAYESNAFFNDNLGADPDFLWTLIGSPGSVPSPGGLAVLGLGGLAMSRRRR